MKKLLVVIFASLLMTACTGRSTETEAKPSSQGSFVFAELEHDFGVIKQSGGIVSHDFHFTYTGKEPIKITSTPASCACTVGSVDKQVYQPGESGVLKVDFNPNLHAEPKGRFEKTVALFTEPKLDPIPEVTVWQEIDLDLGEEAFEMSGGASHGHDDTKKERAEQHDHQPSDHGEIAEIGNTGATTPLKPTKDGVRRFTLTAREVNAPLDEGLSYLYWTYDGVVPGPLLRARVGETIEVTMKNPDTNHFPHSIDLHAVNGPHGGATQVPPGQERTFQFKALNPGVFVYHCATPVVPEHMTNGAYGLIVIEPEDGFEQVDREYYVMQGEVYSILDRGQKGSTQLSGLKLEEEDPEFIVFNGRVGSLVGERALQAEVGDKVRLFVGNGGVAKVSSFHVIGEIFDTVYHEGGSLKNHDVQTTTVPAGGATVVEFKVDVPGTYKLVDHALARMTKGAVGELVVTGDEVPEIFQQLD